MRQVPHVAVLIETSRAYGRGLLEGVSRYVRENGPWSIYCRSRGQDEPAPTWLRRWRGDGILARVDTMQIARVVLATGLPAVDVRRRFPHLDLPRVGTNNSALGQLAARHLLERNFRHFGVCGPSRSQHPGVGQRCEAFARQVEDAGYDCEVLLLDYGRRTWDRDQQYLAAWVRRLAKPVGILAINDDHGVQLLDACRRIGVLVPEEAAVISVGNDPVLCNLATPPLSSIDVNPQVAGYEAAALLGRLMEGGSPPRQDILFDQFRAVTRQSTDVLALDAPELVAAMRFIREHACDGISVEDVAEAAGLSRSALERRLQKVLSRTPKDEILRVQLERAVQLLAETDQPLEMVAGKTGFSSAKYFGEIFYRKKGLRPSAYRRRSRGRS